jgi:hypothetical protein
MTDSRSLRMACGARRCSALALAVTLLLLPGCYASNVVAQQDRAVVTVLDDLEWQPADAADLPGQWLSAEVRGEVAASLWRVLYFFEPGGRYSAAALVAGDAGPSFQTLDGTWTCTEKGIVLDDAEPQRLDKSGEHLRIEAENGSLILRKLAQQ